MPPQRTRNIRHEVSRGFNFPNGPLLARYHTAGIAGAGQLPWRYPSASAATPVIIPIMCPYPVPMQEWEAQQAAALCDGLGGASNDNVFLSSLNRGGRLPLGYELQQLAHAQIQAQVQAQAQQAQAQAVASAAAAAATGAVPEVAVSNAQTAAAVGSVLESAEGHPQENDQEELLLEEDEAVYDEDDSSLPEHKRKYAQVWDAMFDRLVLYKMKHGDCLVPTHFKSDPKLGRWVMNQRHKKLVLSPTRRQRLDNIGFVWSVKQQETWDAMFDRLLKYKMKHGDCLVPQKYRDDSRLGEWVQTQRRDKKRRKNLSPERYARLESIGFEWCPHQYIWDIMFERLCVFKEKYGNCMVPRHYSDDPKLGRWVDQQRVKNKKGNLTPERKEQLDAIGFMWKMR